MKNKLYCMKNMLFVLIEKKNAVDEAITNIRTGCDNIGFEKRWKNVDTGMAIKDTIYIYACKQLVAVM